MGKFDFGDNVRIKNNNFTIDHEYPANAKRKGAAPLYKCYNGTTEYALLESELELVEDNKVIPAPIMVEDKIAALLKDLIDYNAHYVVSFHLGKVTVKEISKEKAVSFEDDYDFLGRS